jgi:hypothetical protein
MKATKAINLMHGAIPTKNVREKITNRNDGLIHVRYKEKKLAHLNCKTPHELDQKPQTNELSNRSQANPRKFQRQAKSKGKRNRFHWTVDTDHKFHMDN